MGIAGMVKRPFTSTLNSSLAALLHLSDNVLVVETIFYSVFFFSLPSLLFLNFFYGTHLSLRQTGVFISLKLLSFTLNPPRDLHLE